MAAPDADGFSAAEFREGIQFAMQMGLDPVDGAVFIMTPAVSGSGVDAHGVPWDPSSVGLLPEAGEEIPALCAIEYSDSSDTNTPGVEAEPAKVLVTILDQDWALVSECIAIRLGGVVYKRNRQRPPLGLFSVGVHQIQFIAGDI